MNRITHSRTQRPAMAGFSMVELLMAMFIFAIGLLGLATLQLATFSQNSTGRSRGTAAFIAHSLLDRVVAEGQVTASERQLNTTGLPTTTTGWTFIGSADATANASGTTVYYDLNGTLIDPSDTTTPKIFTVNWFSRTGTIDTSTHNGIQEFVVNVTWKDPDPKTTGALLTHALSVSRYVRL